MAAPDKKQATIEQAARAGQRLKGEDSAGIHHFNANQPCQATTPRFALPHSSRMHTTLCVCVCCCFFCMEPTSCEARKVQDVQMAFVSSLNTATPYCVVFEVLPYVSTFGLAFQTDGPASCGIAIDLREAVLPLSSLRTKLNQVPTS